MQAGDAYSAVEDGHSGLNVLANLIATQFKIKNPKCYRFL